MAEREEISRGLAAGESLRVIAGRLGRTPSTVSREVARNGGRASYRACRADWAAVRNMRRPKVAKLVRFRRLRAVMEAKLELRWSPQQIASWLVVEFPDDAEMPHETITCRCSCGCAAQELTRYLRMKRSVRRHGRKASPNGQSHIPAMVNISERPAEAPPGRWPRQALFAGTGSLSPAS